MATIDADAHVVECDETWSYMESSDERMVPMRVTVPNAGRQTNFWAIDGRLVSTGPVSETDAVKAVRELADIDGRLQQMDEIATDIQVLYPTIFLRPITHREGLERALCRSYNRWVADRVRKASDRLKWAVVPPTMVIDDAIEEINFGHENGASAVFWRGFENGKLPNDPHFAPLFEEINRLGMALGVHAANGTWEIHDAFPDDNGFFRFKVPGITAFQTILSSGMAKRYPNIRFGFIELASQWVPYALHDYVRRMSRAGQNLDPTKLMAENNMFVACQTDDDLAYVIKYAGPNNLVSGTDFGHADTSSELLALQRLREAGAVAPELINRILDDNPRALYHLA